jgi:plasmid stabilization system protein ParE
MQVRWSIPAAEDLEHICEWIERDNPEAGRRMAGRRELTFAPLPYIVVYQVKPGVVEISRIFHGAQDWP